MLSPAHTPRYVTSQTSHHQSLPNPLPASAASFQHPAIIAGYRDLSPQNPAVRAHTARLWSRLPWHGFARKICSSARCSSATNRILGGLARQDPPQRTPETSGSVENRVSKQRTAKQIPATKDIRNALRGGRHRSLSLATQIDRIIEEMPLDKVGEALAKLRPRRHNDNDTLEARKLSCAGWRIGGQIDRPAKPVQIIEEIFADQQVFQNPDLALRKPARPYVTPKTPFIGTPADLRGIPADAVTLLYRVPVIRTALGGNLRMQYLPPWDLLANLRTTRPAVVVLLQNGKTQYPKTLGGPPERWPFVLAVQRKATMFAFKRAFMAAWKESQNPPDGLYIFTVSEQAEDVVTLQHEFFELLKQVKASPKPVFTKLGQIKRALTDQQIPETMHSSKRDWEFPDGYPVNGLPTKTDNTIQSRAWWSFYCLGSNASPHVPTMVARTGVPGLGRRREKLSGEQTSVKERKQQTRAVTSQLQTLLRQFRANCSTKAQTNTA